MNKDSLSFQQLLERDAAKIREAHKARVKDKLEPEWVVLAEFGMYYGWQAIVAVRNDEITFQDMNKLLAGARQITATHRYNNIIDNYVAVIAPHDKAKSFKQTLKGIKDTFNE